MTVIELGEVPTSGSPPPAPPARLRHADLRRILLGLVAVAVVLGVTGSARPEPPAFRQLWRASVAGGQVALIGDAIYVASADDDPAVTAYDAATGAVRWRARTDRPIGQVAGDTTGSLLIVTLAGPAGEGAAAGEGSGDTVTLDARTGDERWRQRGDLAATVPGAVVLIEWNDQARVTQRVRLVRDSDGAVLWSYEPTVPLAAWTVTGSDPGPPDRDRFVTLTADGRLETRRLTDGVPLASGRIAKGSRAADGDYSYLNARDGLLHIVDYSRFEQSVTTYDLATLRTLWTSPVAGTSAVECERLFCIGDADNGLTALDPRTGAVRWRSPDFEWAQPAGAGRLLAETQTRVTRRALLDEDTGKVVADLGDADAVVDAAAGQLLLLDGITTAPYGRRVSRVVDGHTYVVGRIDEVTDGGCQLGGRRLACRNSDVLTVRAAG